MSYGCAGRRDDRRKAAVPRIENSVSYLKSELQLAKTDEAKKVLKSKIERAEECLKNTQANMGKGTCAMQKSE